MYSFDTKQMQQTLIPISRQAIDVMIIGKKSRGKSFILAINAFLAFLDGKNVYSNMPLNFPYIYLGCLDDFQIMKNDPVKKFFLGDDIENWVSSKFIKNKDKSDILEFTLNAAKYNCELWWSCKRPMECDKTLRSGVDYIIEVSLELMNEVKTISDYEEKSKYLNNCRIKSDIYDPDGWYIKTEYYYDLEIWKDLFDTKKIINKLEVNNIGSY